MPESRIVASEAVTTIVPRFSLGEESHYEDDDSTLFCALKRKTRRENVPTGESPEKGANNFFLAT